MGFVVVRVVVFFEIFEAALIGKTVVALGTSPQRDVLKTSFLVARRAANRTSQGLVSCFNVNRHVYSPIFIDNLARNTKARLS